MRLLARLILPLFLIGCGSGSESQTTLTLTQMPSAHGPEARVIVALWGYDRYLADAGASLIASWQLPLEPTGVVELDIPDEPHALIDQGEGPVAADQAGYYFQIHVDVDGDGQLCPGDLRQDYAVADQEFFDAVPTSLTVPLAPIEAGRACESAQQGS
jgi:hypothetical protein